MMVGIDAVFRFMCNIFTNHEEISAHVSESRFFLLLLMIRIFQICFSEGTIQATI